MRKWIYGMLVAVLVFTGGGVYVYENWWNDFSSLNYYEALGVSPGATTPEIKRAFRELSLRYHPDKSSSEINTRRFHRISDASQTLTNEDDRRAYDIRLSEEQRLRAFHKDLALQRIRITPASHAVGDILTFYLTEFPWQLLGLVVQLMDLRLFVSSLILLGCVVFVFDLLSRFCGRVIRVFSPSHFVAVPKGIKDESLRAARARQQKRSEEQAVIARAELRRRKSEHAAAQAAAAARSL